MVVFSINKISVLLTGLLMLIIGCSAHYNHLSPSTKRLIHLLEENESDSTETLLSNSRFQQFAIQKQGGNLVISGFLQTEPQFDPVSLKNISVEHRFKNDSLYAFVCPVHQIRELIKVKHIDYIQVDMRPGFKGMP